MAWVVLAPSGTLSLLTSYSFIHLPSFIVQEVGPMNELLGEDVEVNFVAYGNADTQEVDGEYVFSCQVRTHGRQTRHTRVRREIAARRGRVLRQHGAGLHPGTRPGLRHGPQVGGHVYTGHVALLREG